LREATFDVIAESTPVFERVRVGLGSTATAVQVQAPPDGNVAPPGHDLLFVLTGTRIPFVGRWIRVT